MIILSLESNEFWSADVNSWFLFPRLCVESAVVFVFQLRARARELVAVECPFAVHGGKSRAINLRHVIGFFDRRLWGLPIKQFLTEIVRR